jgi:hypothetical protein
MLVFGEPRFSLPLSVTLRMRRLFFLSGASAVSGPNQGVEKVVERG